MGMQSSGISTFGCLTIASSISIEGARTQYRKAHVDWLRGQASCSCNEQPGACYRVVPAATCCRAAVLPPVSHLSAVTDFAAAASLTPMLAAAAAAVSLLSESYSLALRISPITDRVDTLGPQWSPKGGHRFEVQLV